MTDECLPVNYAKHLVANWKSVHLLYISLSALENWNRPMTVSSEIRLFGSQQLAD